MNKFYVYIYTDPRTDNIFYVGKGKDRRAWSKRGRNKQVSGRLKILEEIGLKATIDIAYVPSEEDAFWFEKDLIASLGRVDKGEGHLLNHTDGGEGVSGWDVSEEKKKKVSDTLMGHEVSAATRAKISIGHKGKTLDVEHRAKLSKAHIGKVVSEETKKKMSLIRMGRVHSEETRQKISAKAKGRILK